MARNKNNLPSQGLSKKPFATAPAVAYLRHVNLSTNEIGKIEGVIYPNPTTGIINIETEEDLENIAVYTINGSKLPVQLSESGKAIDISDLSTGIYFVRITANNQSQTYKIIKE